MMEAESTFLSKDETKENVFKVLNKVLTDLNARKMTTIIEGETTIHLKIISLFSDPPVIYDHLVPLLNDHFKNIPRESWDLTTQQVLSSYFLFMYLGLTREFTQCRNKHFPNTLSISFLNTLQVLPFINGVNHISRIAADSDVEIGLVKACVQNLVYYQVAEVLPLFKYSNVYMCTRNLKKLSTDKDLLQACR